MRYVVAFESGASAEAFRTAGHDVEGGRLFGPNAPDELTRYEWVEDGIGRDPTSAWDAAYARSSLLASEGVLSVTPDLPATRYDRASSVIGDPDCAGPDDKHWALKQVNAQAAWDLTVPPGRSATGAGVRIGHPDTGYGNHPEMTGVFNLDLDHDFVDGGFDARDPLGEGQTGHGTSTASVIAGRKADAIAGVAPGAEIVPLRVMNRVWHIFDSRVARGVECAASDSVGAHIISMSLGGIGFRHLREAIDVAIRRNLLVLAAAGQFVHFVVPPAAYRDVIAVAASTEEREPWRRSCRGEKVAITAPGYRVWVASFQDDQTQAHRICAHDGTSFAVAHAAGAAALWLSYHGRQNLIDRFGPGNLQRAFLKAIGDTAHVPAGWDTDRYGSGILDSLNLVTTPLPTTTEVASVAMAPDPIDTAIDSFLVSQNVSEDLGRLVAEELRYLIVEHGTADEDGVLDVDSDGFLQQLRSRGSGVLRETLAID